MGNTRIMPRHLLLLALPIGTAIIGGMINTNNLSSFMVAGGRGISQAQLYFSISLLTGILAFSLRCLTKTITYLSIVIVPLVYALLAMPYLGNDINFVALYALNLSFAAGLWLALRYIVFAKSMLRVRTMGFALVSAILLSLYYKLLFMLLKIPFTSSNWSGYFWNSLFLFVFIGFGLSIADVVVLRKEIAERKASQRSRDDELGEDLEDEDDL